MPGEPRYWICGDSRFVALLGWRFCGDPAPGRGCASLHGRALCDYAGIAEIAPHHPGIARPQWTQGRRDRRFFAAPGKPESDHSRRPVAPRRRIAFLPQFESIRKYLIRIAVDRRRGMVAPRRRPDERTDC